MVGTSTPRWRAATTSLTERATRTAALGWRTHSGWAVLVAIAGPPETPEVLYRQRVALLDGSLPHQPYHAAADEGLPLDQAAKLVSRVARAATAAATSATAAVVAELARSGCTAGGVGLVAPDRAVPSELNRILASHPQLHAAEGQLFERAVLEGSVGLAVTTVPPKAVFEQAAENTSMSLPDLIAALRAAGRAAGPPWQKDHREAAAAALVALYR